MNSVQALCSTQRTPFQRFSFSIFMEAHKKHGERAKPRSSKDQREQPQQRPGQHQSNSHSAARSVLQLPHTAAEVLCSSSSFWTKIDVVPNQFQTFRTLGDLQAPSWIIRALQRKLYRQGGNLQESGRLAVHSSQPGNHGTKYQSATTEKRYKHLYLSSSRHLTLHASGGAGAGGRCQTPRICFPTWPLITA